MANRRDPGRIREERKREREAARQRKKRALLQARVTTEMMRAHQEGLNPGNSADVRRRQRQRAENLRHSRVEELADTPFSSWSELATHLVVQENPADPVRAARKIAKEHPALARAVSAERGARRV